MGWNSDLWALFLVCMTVGWVITTWIRARHGYPVEDTWGGRAERSDHPDLQKRLNEELARRDATIARLEERVRVLERIATDRSAALDEELERLRV